MKKTRKEPVRYLARFTSFHQIEELPTKKEIKKREKIRHYKNGTYSKQRYYKRKGKIFSQVTRWAYLDSKTQPAIEYDKLNDTFRESEREISYIKWIEKYAAIEIKKGAGDITASVQKFSGKITGTHTRKLKGEMSKAVYLKSLHVNKKSGIGLIKNAVPEFENRVLEAEMLSGSGEFKKRRRKRKSKKSNRRKKGVRRNGNRKRKNRNIRH